ncbi:MAG: MoaD/ThiS family protein [Acidimicrobiia bacterium]
MATLRLFANLREIAGETQVEIDAATVGEVVDSAVERYGQEFGRGVESARVWINGDPASADTPVGATDEVVLLPPVSGGAQAAAAITPADFIGFLPLALIILAFLANLAGQAIWGAFLVLAVAIWAVDVSSAFRVRGRELPALPIVVTSTGAVIAAHTMGSAGYGITIAIAVLVGIGWAVAFVVYREVDTYSPMFLTSLIGGLAAASLILSRSAFSPSDRAVDVFIVSVAVAVALGALAIRMQHLPLLDPFSVMALGAILAAVGAAAFWDLDVVGYLLVGLGVAVSLVAGRGLSSMLRLGRVSLTEISPGAVASLDGVLLAAAIYYPLIRIIL